MKELFSVGRARRRDARRRRCRSPRACRCSRCRRRRSRRCTSATARAASRTRTPSCTTSRRIPRSSRRMRDAAVEARLVAAMARLMRAHGRAGGELRANRLGRTTRPEEAPPQRCAHARQSSAIEPEATRGGATDDIHQSGRTAHRQDLAHRGWACWRCRCLRPAGRGGGLSGQGREDRRRLRRRAERPTVSPAWWQATCTKPGASRSSWRTGRARAATLPTNWLRARRGTATRCCSRRRRWPSIRASIATSTTTR